MPRLALTAAVLATVVLAGCAGSSEPHVALVAASDPLANVQPVESIPTTVPPPPTTDPALARLAAARAEAARASRGARRTATPVAVRPVAVSGDVWGALARCESGGNPRAVGGGGRYFGAFQFSLGTWHSLGMGGNPIDYDYGTQLAAAQRLVARGGWGQFPHCSRSIGAR